MISSAFLIYYQSILKLKVYNINNDSRKFRRIRENSKDNSERY